MQTQSHWIIQDAYTGYVWGDTRDFVGTPQSITQACRMLDESLGVRNRKYTEVPRLNGDSGYVLYTADLLPCNDGQDQAYIDELEQSCIIVGYVEFSDSGDTTP